MLLLGARAEVGTSATIGNDRNNASLGAAVSVGPQIGAKVGGGATVDDGKLTVGADVKSALKNGVSISPSITVDTRPVMNPIIYNVVAPVSNAAKSGSKACKKAAKKMKFW